jgi:hypothetical protein
MASTTNYSWTTPDDTSLVKDGASAIRTLGSSVDTTVKALNPETTLGDIAYRSSTANVKTRLGLGTAGQVLQVNSGANAPEWATFSAGAMTLLSTTTLSGASTTISSISGSYKNLVMFIYGVTGTGSSNTLFLKPNNDSSNSYLVQSTNNGASVERRGNNILLSNSVNSQDATNSNNYWSATIDNYAGTTRKSVSIVGGSFGGNQINSCVVNGYIDITTAITSLVFNWNTGNLSAGTVELYGVK